MKDNVIEFKAREMFGYTILCEESLDDLIDEIENLVEDGWKPHGAPFVACGGDGYCQAMKWVREGSIEE